MVTLESSDTTALTISSARLVFTSENWNISQEITVTAKDDDDADDETVTITHQTVGLFAGNQTVTDNVIVTVRDDDMGGVIVEPLMLEVDEGSSESYTVRLRSAPPGDGEVRVTVRSDNLDVTVTPSTQTFTASDWSSPKEFTVSALDDSSADDESATLTHSVTGYGGVTANAVAVYVNDDDMAGVIVEPLVLEVDEGSSESYTVRLRSVPPRRCGSKGYGEKR